MPDLVSSPSGVSSDKIHYQFLSDTYCYRPESLVPAAAVGWQRRYQVKYQVVEQESTDVLQYEVYLALVAIKGTSRQYSLTKSNYLINGLFPEGVVDSINVAAASVLYPLEVVTDASGALTHIVNYSDMVARWPSVKEEQMKRYGGQLMDWYLQSMEDTLLNKEAFLQAMQQDMLLFVATLPLYGNYGREKKKQLELALPQLQGTLPLACNALLQLQPTLTPEKQLQIDLSASPAVPLTQAALLAGGLEEETLPPDTLLQATVSGKLRLETEHYMLEEVELETKVLSEHYQKQVNFQLRAL